MCEPSFLPDDIRCVWSWIIEYLASCPVVDCATLHGLVEQAAQVLNKRARERISLRCLEELISASNAVDHKHPRGTEQKVVLDSSHSCEDVLQSIYQETSGLRKGGSEVLQWDLQPYIMHKKVSMPKSTLVQQLKETIAQGSCPSYELFSKYSGLCRGNNGSGTFGQCRQDPADNKLQGSRGLTGDNAEKMSRHISDVLQETSLEGEANGVEPRVPSDTASNACHRNVPGDGHGYNKEPKSSDAPSTSRLTSNCNVDEENGHTGHPDKDGTEKDTSGHERLRVDIDAEKRTLRSQHLLSKHFLDAAGWSGSNLCFRCEKNGQLLYCGTDDCCFVTHESCLGLTPSFDSRGQFCCPFCAYSLAISHLTKKKEASSLKLKQLSEFLHVGLENPSMEHTERLDAKENGEPEAFGDVGCVAGVNRTGNFEEKELNPTNSGKDVDEGSDFQFENGADMLHHSPVAAHGIHDQRPGGPICNSSGSGERQAEGTTLACPSVRAPEKNKDQDLPDVTCLSGNLLSAQNGIVSETQDLTEGATKKKSVDGIGQHKQVMPNSRGIGESQIEGTTLVCPSIRAPEKNKDHDLPDVTCLSGNLLGEQNGIVSEKQDLTEGVTKKKSVDGIGQHKQGMHNSRGSGERQTEGTTLACPSVRAPEKNKDQDLPDVTCLSGNLLGEQNGIVSEKQDLTEGATKKKSVDGIGQQKQAMPTHVPMDVGASDKGLDKATTSKDSLGLRKRKCEDAARHPTRRQKILWTKAEEDMLKEAVPMFTRTGVIRWLEIKKHGASVFHAGRTADDLRGKWKLMMRKESTSTS